ncbi:MAG TPA: PAS domain S-box protein [Candidatus Thermoplasmatota archaeon]|nr:PAS domain S-box protein [Candidatus Thermoplasmatota archaeon]
MNPQDASSATGGGSFTLRPAVAQEASPLQRLASLAEALAEAITPPEVAEAVATRAAAALGASAAMVARYNEGTGLIHLLHAQGYRSPRLQDFQKMPLDLDGPVPEAIRRREIILLESPEEWDARYPALATLRDPVTYAFATVPLLSRGRVLGALHLSFPRPHAVKGEDRAFLLTAAHLCAQALDRAELLETEREARREAEAALEYADRRQQEDRFLLDESADIVARYATDRVVQYVSPAVQTLLGYSPEELVGRTPDWIVHPEDLLQIQRSPPAPDENGVLTLVHRTRHKDGHWVWVEARWKRFVDPATGHPTGGFSVTRDITAKKATEDALRAAEARWRALMESAPAVIYCLDERFRLTFLNRVSTGFTREGVLGVSFDAFLLGEDIPRVRALLERVWQTGEPEVYEARAKTLHRELRWYRCSVGAVRSGNVTESLVIVAIDVTQHHEAAARLAASEAYQKALVESMDEALFVVAFPARTITFANPAAERMFGYAEGEMVGLETRVLHVDEAHYQEFGSLIKTPFERGVPAAFEFRMRRRNGEAFPTEHVLTLLRGPDGEDLGVVSIVRDTTERKQAERILRESRDLLEALVEGAPDPIFLKDEEGRYVVANSAAARVAQVRRDQFIGRRARDLFPSAVAERMEREDREILESGRPARTTQRIPIEGKVRTFITEKVPYRDRTGRVRGIIGVGRDVTDLVAAEVATKEANALLASVINSTTDIVFVLDEAGRYLLVNEAAARLTGRAPQEIVGLGPEDFFPPELVANLREEDRQVLATGSTLTFEEALQTPAGPRIYLTVKAPRRDAAGRSIGIVGIARDITSIREAALALREKHDLLQAILESTDDLVFVLDLEGRYVHANTATAKAVGRAVPDLLGRACGTFYPPETARLLKAENDLVLATGRVQTFEAAMETATRGTRHLLTVKAPYRDGNGHLIGIVGFVRDVTEAKQAAEERQRLKEALNRSEKMAALGTLVSGVAHEVRTPLTYIRNNAFVAERRLRRTLEAAPAASPSAVVEDVLPLLKAVSDGVDRVSSLVDQLRRFIRNQAGEVAPAALDDVVGEGLRLFETAHPGRVPLTKDLATTPTLPLQRLGVQQVVLNLIENAADAVRPQGGSVRVSTRATPDGGAQLVVEDDGPGIPEEVRGRMFEPLFTTKAHGTGLGLSIVRRIVEEHGGTIMCDSTLGKGTRFTVTFPRP